MSDFDNDLYHPQVAAYFATLKAAKAPRIHTLPVPVARAGIVRAAKYFGGPVTELASVEDLTVEGAAGPLAARMYRPHGLPDGLAPTLIYFHGGGWTVGCIESYDKVCRNLAAACGCAVLSVEYRLAPEHPLPAAPLDAIAGTEYVASHAAELGIDPTRIGVAGDSAGGALAAVVAIAARDAGIRLRCQILFYPTTDVRSSADRYASRVANAEDLMLGHDTTKWFGMHSRPVAPLPVDWHVSVLLAPDVRRVAPALIVTAERDMLHDEAVLYANRLEDAGVEVMRRNFTGMIHGFLNLGGVIDAAGEALETTALFVRQRLLPVG